MVKSPPAVQEAQATSGLIPGSRQSPGGEGVAAHPTCLENPVDRGAWQAVVHGVAKRHNHAHVWPHTQNSTRKSFAVFMDSNV